MIFILYSTKTITKINCAFKNWKDKKFINLHSYLIQEEEYMYTCITKVEKQIVNTFQLNVPMTDG